jgi:hypothetical protein
MAYDTLSPYAGAYPQTKEEIPTPEATAKAMRQAGRDLGVGSLRFGTFMAMAPEIAWLANKMALNVGHSMMMADPAYQSFPQKEKEAYQNIHRAAQGKRGDEQHQEWAKGQLNKYHGMDFWEWSEQIPELLDEIIPLETTEGSKAVENIEMLLTLGWGLAGIAQLLKLAATKGPAWLRKKLKSIVKNKQGEEILDDIVPEASLQIEHKPVPEARIDKTVERTMEGAGEVPLLPSVRTGYMPSTSGYASPKTKMYHGAKGELPEEFMGFEDYASSKSSAYGDGFYTTSRTGTAKGYAGKEGKLYEVTPKKEVKLFDMEQPVPPSIKQYIKRGADPDYGLKDLDPIVRKAQMEYGWETANYWDNVQDFLKDNPKASLAELYDEMRALAPYENIPAYEVDEIFHGFASILQKSGYQGLRHKGGVLSSRPKKHEVNIYWNPGKDLNIKPVAKADLAAGEKTVERATAEKTPLQRSGDLMNQFLEEAGIASDIKISSTGSITTPKTKPKTVERVTKEDLSLKTTIDATPGGPDYTKSGALRKTPASEVDTEQLLKRMNNRAKKRVAEGNREVAKIKKEYADMGIEEFTENGKVFVTKPDGMTNEEALKKASEMYKRQNAVRDKIRKKWDNLDIAKEEAAAYKRAYKYWEDRFEKAADFQPSDKLNKALFKDHPEIWTQQKREALAVRHINSPEARAVEKELKEAKKRVGERFKAREIGEVEMYKQGALLREKAYKKLEELLFDQIKSEVELAVKSDPFKEFEDMVLKKGDYKDITLHSRGGLVENKVNYALNQWK